MEQKNLKINQISGKKKTRIKTLPDRNHRSPDGAPMEDLQSQVLSWDGLAAALSFSIPFAVVVSTTLQSALALSAILAAVLLPVSLLRFALREKLGFPSFVTVPLCGLASLGIISFAAVIIRHYFPQINDSLGIYLYLLAAYPVVAAVFYGRPARRMTTALAWSLRNLIYFTSFTVFTGIIRELLAYNRLMGFELPLGLRLDAAKMPFFGFLMLAFVLAAVTRLHMAMQDKPAAAPNAPNTPAPIAPEPRAERGESAKEEG